MAQQQLFQHTYPNGLTLLAERLDHVRSATFYFLIPSGFTYDSPTTLGMSSVLAEMLTRGAGERDSKQLSLALDNLGTDRSESVGSFNIVLSAGTLARNVPAALAIYADIIRRPHLPEDELAAVQDLLLQDILGLEDSPQEKVILELKSRYYPSPLNRNRYGTTEGIQAIQASDVKAHYGNRFQARGAILSVAGAIDWPALQQQVGELFGDWPGRDEPEPVIETHTPLSTHLLKDTQQTQIALAFPSASFTDPDYYAARGAVGVLSGGMSSRLFTEVREKRGLCYSVYASHDTVKDRGAMICYAGTRADRAQETLDVTVGELRRLKDGVTVEELDRLKASLKTSLVMSQESTSSRASSMATDWFYLRRVRTVDEVQAAINRLTTSQILAYLERFPVKDITLVTLGPDPLRLPG